MALENLSALATSQNGTARIRTERLHAVIKNVFLAEFRLSRQIIASSTANADAANHERHAKQWLKPNAFGTIGSETAEIRIRASDQLDLGRMELLAQIREADALISDLHKLREHRATLILAETVRSIATRRFSSGESSSSFPNETLAAIRAEISSRRWEGGSISTPVSAR